MFHANKGTKSQATTSNTTNSQLETGLYLTTNKNSNKKNPKGVNPSLIIWPHVSIRCNYQPLAATEGNEVFDFMVVKPIDTVPFMNTHPSTGGSFLGFINPTLTIAKTVAIAFHC